MSEVFADTAFFLALLSRRDDYHGAAVAANQRATRIVTSSWILIELGDHLCDARHRELYAQLLDAVAADARFTLVPADQSTLDEATQLYREREDKDWSLTDCTSFVIMQQRHINEALTADHHFTQAGFVTMLQ